MKKAIVYSTHTGNTRILAEYIEHNVADVFFCGEAHEEAFNADKLYVGFWTDKGTCDESIQLFLSKCHHKDIFLFGTCGFGGSKEYYDSILNNVKTLIPSDNRIMGSFMCQGKMPMSVRSRYESLDIPDAKKKAMIDNFDQALSHPNQNDLDLLIKSLK